MATQKVLFSLSVFQYDIDKKEEKETNFLSAVGKLSKNKNFLIVNEELVYSLAGVSLIPVKQKVLIFGDLINLDEALKVFAKDKAKVEILSNLRKEGEYVDSRVLLSRKRDVVLLPFPLLHTWCVSAAKEFVCKQNVPLATDYEFETTGNGYTFKGLCFQDVLKVKRENSNYLNITAFKRCFYANGAKVISQKRAFCITTSKGGRNLCADEIRVSDATLMKW